MHSKSTYRRQIKLFKYSLMNKCNEILQKIALIKYFCSSADVYMSVCNCVTKTLNEIRDQIIKIPSNTENNEFDAILTLLDDLYNITKSFNKDKWIQSNLQVPIDKPITDIKEIISSITKLLNNIGITLVNNCEITNDNISEDINSIYGIISDPSKLDDPKIKAKLKEIEEYLKNIGKPLIIAQPSNPISSNDLSQNSDGFDKISDYNDVQKYKLNESDITYDKPTLIPDSITVTGEYKGTDGYVKVTLFDPSKFDDDRFKRFISVLTAVNHNNIEEFIGAVENPPTFIIVTKADGEKLSKILQRQNCQEQQKDGNDYDNNEYDDDDDDDDAVNEEEAKSDEIVLKEGYRTIIAYQIATAMAYLHSINITHRDLCSENVTIDSEFNARLTNFENSRFVPANQSSMSTRLSFEKHPFQAPELSDPNGYTTMADVFAFGGILYELLTYEAPFKGENRTTIQYNMLHQLWPEIPLEKGDDLRELIESCWSINPDERPSFATIIDTMLTKSIAFPCDRKSDITKQFYASKKVKNNGFKTIFSTIKQIQVSINNSSVYKMEAFRIRTLLNGYFSLLETSEYAALPEIEDEKVKTEILNLQTSLQKLLNIMTYTEMNMWISIASTIDPLEIPEKMLFTMEQIYISLTQLGFKVLKYKYIASDLRSDLRWVYSYLSERVDEEKLIEIKNKLEQNGISIEITQKEINDLIKEMLNRYKKYEVNRDDFTIEDLIGSGGNAKVYRAKQESSGNVVAIKEFESDYFQNKHCVFLLRREIDSLVSLDNEYLVKFIGFNIDCENIWIVMEYVEGGSLENKIKYLDPYTKTKIAFEVAQGMAYLNSQNKMHRDLKSGNILIENSSSLYLAKPKICDFGYARSETASNVEKTERAGTLIYMAPEVIRSKFYGYKADVFSFGLLLFEMYSESMPYYWIVDKEMKRIGHFNAIIIKNAIENYMIRNGKLVYKKDINPKLRQLIEDCKNFNPDLRPSFPEIIERMINDKICFNGADENDVKEFYKMKADEIQNMKK